MEIYQQSFRCTKIIYFSKKALFKSFFAIGVVTCVVVMKWEWNVNKCWNPTPEIGLRNCVTIPTLVQSRPRNFKPVILR